MNKDGIWDNSYQILKENFFMTHLIVNIAKLQRDDDLREMFSVYNAAIVEMLESIEAGEKVDEWVREKTDFSINNFSRSGKKFIYGENKKYGNPKNTFTPSSPKIRLPKETHERLLKVEKANPQWKQSGRPLINLALIGYFRKRKQYVLDIINEVFDSPNLNYKNIEVDEVDDEVLNFIKNSETNSKVEKKEIRKIKIKKIFDEAYLIDK